MRHSLRILQIQTYSRQILRYASVLMTSHYIPKRASACFNAAWSLTGNFPQTASVALFKLAKSIGVGSYPKAASAHTHFASDRGESSCFIVSLANASSCCVYSFKPSKEAPHNPRTAVAGCKRFSCASSTRISTSAWACVAGGSHRTRP